MVEGLNFMASHVLQVPLFLMTLMRYITPTLDNLYAGPGRKLPLPPRQILRLETDA